MQEALSGAHALVLLAEALRLAVVRAGVRYRALFAWLLTAVRRMSNEEPNAQKHHFQTDAQALSEFIHGQLFQDAIGPQLHPVRCFLAVALPICASSLCPCSRAAHAATSKGRHFRRFSFHLLQGQPPDIFALLSQQLCFEPAPAAALPPASRPSRHLVHKRLHMQLTENGIAGARGIRALAVAHARSAEPVEAVRL